jgi:hypothetical protein
MAEINWGALQTPDFAGNALRYRRAGEEDGRETATRNALKGYGTNPDGAIQDLMGVNPDVAMQLQDRQRVERERQAKVQGAQSYAKRDWEGARNAYAGAGDVSSVASVDEAQAASAKRVADEAQFVLKVFKEKGLDAALSTFDQRSPSYGASPDQLAMIRAKIAEDPENNLTALAGAPSYKYQFGRDGQIVSVNEATGETDVVKPGQPAAPAGYQFRPDGSGLEFIPGGPADPRQAGTLSGAKRAPPRAGSGGGGAALKPGKGPPMISSREQFDALPKGTVFKAPDGTVRRK